VLNTPNTDGSIHIAVMLASKRALSYASLMCQHVAQLKLIDEL